jgi:hypothetical protein
MSEEASLEQRVAAVEPGVAMPGSANVPLPVELLFRANEHAIYQRQIDHLWEVTVLQDVTSDASPNQEVEVRCTDNKVHPVHVRDLQKIDLNAPRTTRGIKHSPNFYKEATSEEETTHSSSSLQSPDGSISTNTPSPLVAHVALHPRWTPSSVARIPVAAALLVSSQSMPCSWCPQTIGNAPFHSEARRLLPTVKSNAYNKISSARA